MQKKCPVTKLPIARRYAVHHSVLAEMKRIGRVVNNPNTGTLRRWIYRY